MFLSSVTRFESCDTAPAPSPGQLCPAERALREIIAPADDMHSDCGDQEDMLEDDEETHFGLALGDDDTADDTSSSVPLPSISARSGRASLTMISSVRWQSKAAIE